MKTWIDAIEASKNAPVVVLFTSPTCGPCQMIKPALARRATEHGFAHLVLNVMEVRGLVEQLGIRAVPTMYVLKDGRAAAQYVGASGGERELWTRLTASGVIAQ